MNAVGMDNVRQATRHDEISGRFDPWLMAAMVMLASLGLVMVGSAAIAGGGQNAGPWYFLSRHVVFMSCGLITALLVMRVELKTVEKYSQWLLLGCFLLGLRRFCIVNTIDDVLDFLGHTARRNTLLQIETDLLFAPPPGFGDGTLHGLRNCISIKDGCAMDMTRRPAHGLDQRALGAQKALLVGIENCDQ